MGALSVKLKLNLHKGSFPSLHQTRHRTIISTLHRTTLQRKYQHYTVKDTAEKIALYYVVLHGEENIINLTSPRA